MDVNPVRNTTSGPPGKPADTAWYAAPLSKVSWGLNNNNDLVGFEHKENCILKMVCFCESGEK